MAAATSSLVTARRWGKDPAPQTVAAPPNILLCIADDWSAGIKSLYPTLRLPNIARLAREGIVFDHAFTVSPTCAAARAGLLTGQPPHRLEQAANLWGTLAAKFPVYPDLLEAAGYFIGYAKKGYSPAIDGDRPRNAAGPFFNSFNEFLGSVPAGRPFCFWYGSFDPHRPYDRNLAEALGLRSSDVHVPGFLPNVPQVSRDLLDYCAEVHRFDTAVGDILSRLDESGRAQDTLVVLTSDNGMPFPRAKANLYDAGTRVPMIIRFPGKVTAGRNSNALVSHLDLAPTFLQLAGLPIPAAVAGNSLVDLLSGRPASARSSVFFERERHVPARAGNVGYPIRAIRTSRYLLVRNVAPDRWPAGDPTDFAGLEHYGDIDGGPTKVYLREHADEQSCSRLFSLACAKRPATELYDVIADSWQLNDLAAAPAYAGIRNQMNTQLTNWMTRTADPRATGGGSEFDTYPYYGPANIPATAPVL